MSTLEIPLKVPIAAGDGLIKTVVFSRRPAAKQLINHGSFLNPDTTIDWVALSKYVFDLTDLGMAEIDRLDQIDFAIIGQRLADWVYLDGKKLKSSTK